MTTHYHYLLHWRFTNSRELVKIFDSKEEAKTHALVYGLCTHPSIEKLEIKAMPYTRKKGAIKASAFDDISPLPFLKETT